ncbi:MAG: hypothetical protein JWO81_1567 [Alphaproteobacteria bacterium]|nr:hypothetical protein [Alphaproteobacteria bacterium]
MTALTDRFGKPTSLVTDRTVVEGIAVPSLHAIWKTAGMTVEYHSVDESMDYGRAIFRTPDFDRLKDQSDRGKAAQRIRL